MSKKARLLAALLVIGMLVPSLAGCTFGTSLGTTVVTGSGRTTTKDYDFSGFTKVSIGSAFQADIKQGESYSTSVTVDDNLVEYLDVRVDGNTLHIGLKPALSLNLRNTALNAAITMPDVEGLDLSGATRTQLTGFKNTKPVNVQVSGASQLHGDLTSGQMNVQASGASTLELTGSTGPLDVDASGASTVRFDNMKSADTHVRASGASNITVNPSGKLTGDASGASHISYAGNPASVQVNTSGASSVKQK